MQELGFVDGVTGKLRPHRAAQHAVPAPHHVRLVAHQVSHDMFVIREEAVAKRAVRRETQPIARATERLGDDGDQSNLTAPVSKAEPLRGRGAFRLDRHRAARRR